MLLIDIAAVVPFYLIIDDQNGARSNVFIRFFRMARLSRILRASKILKLVKHVVSSERLVRITRLIRTYDSITRLSTGVFFVVILAHFTACM